MSSYQKKYISLKDAAIISGYTVAELKNFTKIGLVQSTKRGRAVYIRFDAFEKINKHMNSKKSQASVPIPVPAEQHLSSPAPTSLIPFTQPHPALLKVLEPVAFTAALVMVLHLTMIPTVAQRVVGSISLAMDTVAFMGDATHNAIATTLTLPDTLSDQLALAITTPYYSSDVPALAPRVAGTSTTSRPSQPAFVVVPEGSAYSSGFDLLMIGIADASDTFQWSLDEFNAATRNAVMGAVTFESLDPFITSTFRW